MYAVRHDNVRQKPGGGMAQWPSNARRRIVMRDHLKDFGGICCITVTIIYMTVTLGESQFGSFSGISWMTCSGSLSSDRGNTVKIIVTVVLIFLLVSLSAFGQSNYAELSGTVLDPGHAAIVGASIQ